MLSLPYHVLLLIHHLRTILQIHYRQEGSFCVLKVSVTLGDVEGLIPMFVLAPEILDLERHQELVGEQKLALSSYRTSDIGIISHKWRQLNNNDWQLHPQYYFWSLNEWIFEVWTNDVWFITDWFFRFAQMHCFRHTWDFSDLRGQMNMIAATLIS